MELNAKSLAEGTLIIAVSVIIVTALLIPSISVATTETYTYLNEGTPYALVDEDTHTIRVDLSSGSPVLSCDGVEMDPAPYSQYSLVVGESEFIRYNPSTGASATTISGTTYNATGSHTITINGNTATIALDGGGSRTITGVFAYQSPVGDYVLSTSPTVKEDTPIIGAGNTYFSTSVVPGTLNLWIAFNGTLSDLDVTPVVTIPPTQVTHVATQAVTEKLVSDLVHIDEIQFDFIVNSDTDPREISVHYTYFLTPKAIEYANESYTPATASIIGIIPLLVLTGLVIGVVGSFIRNRD